MLNKLFIEKESHFGRNVMSGVLNAVVLALALAASDSDLTNKALATFDSSEEASQDLGSIKPKPKPFRQQP